MSETTNSHLFAVRTTGGQEKVVLRLLETKMRSGGLDICLLYTSPSPRDRTRSRMPSSA